MAGYPNLIKVRAKQYGYTLDELAKRVHVSRRMFSNYCNGHFHIPRMLLEAIAYELQCPVEALVTDDIQYQQQHDYGSSVGRSDIVDRKRREVLALLGVASVALILPPIVDWERVTATITRPSLLDEAFLSDLEAINISYWGVYRTSARKGLILEGVLGHLKTLTSFLRELASEKIHRQVRILTSDLAQLAGEIWFDADEYTIAQSCYTFAANAAKEARQYDLWACAFVRHAFLPIYERNYHDALPLLEHARQLSLRGDSMLVTRQWAAAVEAEAQSWAGNLARCQDALECAYEVTHRQDGSNGRWLRFDGERLPEQTGSCYVRLKQPHLAEPALQQALQQLPTPSRRQGMVLSDLALAALQQQDIEQACFYIEQVIETATNVPSGWLKKGVATLHNELEPFQALSRVSQLDQQLLQLS
jgi:transcriptional regulator with XRE-family HTH domain